MPVQTVSGDLVPRVTRSYVQCSLLLWKGYILSTIWSQMGIAITHFMVLLPENNKLLLTLAVRKPEIYL